MMSSYETLCPGCFEDKGTAIKCPSCQYDEGKKRAEILLPYRTLLSENYLIGKELGKGGFGITYLAHDTTLKCLVAIKEFFPKELVARDAGNTTLTPYSDETSKSFSYGLKKFISEAQTMAKFNHPNIVRVKALLEENNTAYIVMDYYIGQTLAKLITTKGKPLSEEETMRIIPPVLDGLEKIHKKSILHRDIKPQNIYITTGGKPILLDFGAARYVTGTQTQNLTVVLTRGYAPFEQYRTSGKQGAWTDIYSCCATLYFMLTGAIPPDASDRVEDDTIVPLEKISPGLSRETRSAIMQGLEMKIDDRPQTVDEFREMLPSESPIKKIKIFSLKCISGDYEGNTIQLDEDPIAIGKDPRKVNLVVSHPEVSKVHAQVWIDEENEGAWVGDCNSLNGTFLCTGSPGSEESQWKKIQEKQLLKPGHRFRLGIDGDKFEIEATFIEEEETEDRDQVELNIVKCPACNTQNKVPLNKSLEEVTCETCRASLASMSKKKVESPIIDKKEEPVYAKSEKKPKRIIGWVILILTAIAIIVASFLVS